MAEPQLLEAVAGVARAVPWPPPASPWLPNTFAAAGAPGPRLPALGTPATVDDRALLPSLALGLFRIVAQASRACADALVRGGGVLVVALRFVVPDVADAPDAGVGPVAAREAVRAEVPAPWDLARTWAKPRPNGSLPRAWKTKCRPC